MKHQLKQRAGFTLLEILLVVAAIAILAGIVILAINPGKQLGDTRNADRRSDVNTILNAVYQYSLDFQGFLPTAITTGDCTTDTGATLAAEKICATGGTCTGITDLSLLVPTYVVGIPEDPQDTDPNGTGYYISQDANNRVTVCAPGAEQGATINVIR